MNCTLLPLNKEAIVFSEHQCRRTQYYVHDLLLVKRRIPPIAELGEIWECSTNHKNEAKNYYG